MHLFTRATFGASMFVAGLLGGLALFEALAGGPETVTVEITADPLPPPPPPKCDASWMPPGYTMPLPAARTAELAKAMSLWIEGSGASDAPSIDATRGLVLAGSNPAAAPAARVRGCRSPVTIMATPLPGSPGYPAAPATGGDRAPAGDTARRAAAA